MYLGMKCTLGMKYSWRDEIVIYRGWNVSWRDEILWQGMKYYDIGMNMVLLT